MNKTALIIVGILNYVILAVAGSMLLPHWATFGWYFLSSMLCSFIVINAIMEENRIKREEELYGFGVSFGGRFDQGDA